MNNKEHKFWESQPVVQYNENFEKIGPLENKTIYDIRKEPYNLPESFYWVSMDVNNNDDLDDIYNLLYNNYVADDTFKFKYSKEFLKWALTPPGYFPNWHVGIKMKGKNNDKCLNPNITGCDNNNNHKLIGFISGIPVKIGINKNINKNVKTMCEINFLCCWDKLRNKRLAPVMIKEITRRVNLCNIFQAVYTAGIVIPDSFSKSTYYHRPLNIQKLVETGFTPLRNNTSISMVKKLYNLPENTLSNIRLMEEKDIESAHKLLSEYLKRFTIYPVWTIEEFKYWFIPKDNIIYTYVITDNNKVTDFCSFFSVDNTVLNNNKYDNLKIAYGYYNVSTTINITDLINSCLIFAKNTNHDVFNVLDLMNNKEYLDKLKFRQGSGTLNYYLYNFNLNKINSDENGIVLF